MANRKFFRNMLAGTVSALALASGAAAQQPATESVTVTGSRIVNGNSMPTPTTIVSLDQLESAAPTSIPEALQQLPMFAAGFGTTSRIAPNGRGFGTPTNNLNMRGLGAIRTLILMDGKRVPGTFYDTTVNVDMLPQMLVQRVDIVSGGASAVYGSDAVAGVVNYVLDKNFQGFKAQAQGGISDRGDAATFKLGFAAGFDVLDKGHFEMSAEYFNRDSIPDASARPFGNPAYACQQTGAGTTANPVVMSCNIRQPNASPYGLIASGPFRGFQFSPDGRSIIPFNPGTTTGTGNANQGGDGGVLQNEGLIAADHTGQAYARFDYEFNDRISFYTDARYASAWTSGASQGYTNIDAQYPIWLASDNAFFTPAQRAQLFPAGVNAVNVGRFNNDLMRQLQITQQTDALAFSFGFQGKTFGDWTWDTHYTYGDNTVNLLTKNNVNSRRFYAAIDAVVDPATGTTVCRTSITNPGAFPNCTPLNLLGQNNSSPAAQQYIFGNTWWEAQNKMHDVAVNLTGTVFEGWAGPIKTAVGLEYRRQSLNVQTSEPDGVTFASQGLRLAPFGTYNSGNGGTAATNPFGSYPSSNLEWFKEVQSGGRGSEDIVEGNIELDIPLLRDLPMAQLVTFNGAYRYTQYAAEGTGLTGNVSSEFSANTYKAGLEWTVNDDVRFRVSHSRDMRAPTLWDLYQQQVITSSGITDTSFCLPSAPTQCVGTNLNGPVNTVSGGNPNLRPETSFYNTAGVVLSPTFIPGLTLSVDYYHVKIGNAIGTLAGNNNTAYTICLQSNLTSPVCNLIERPLGYTNQSPANFPTRVFSLNQNVALNKRSGFDTELNYTTDLSSWTDMNGFLNFRLFWNHQEVSASQPLPGAVITNAVNTINAPRDRAQISLGYTYEDFSATITEQYIAPVNWQGSTSPNINRVFNLPQIPAYYLTSVALNYDFTVEDQPVTGFLHVNNLFDVDGPITGGFNGSPGMLYPVPVYADIIGRYFTLGVKVRM